MWLVKGRSLLKASPEQLRRATEREELLEGLSEPSSQATPWTFHTVAEQVGGNKFEDISKEVPDVTEWQRAQRPEEEIQPTRFRVRRKRPATELSRAEKFEEIDIGPEEEPGEAARGRSRSRGKPPQSPSAEATAWWSSIPEREWPETQASYWRAVELSEKRMTAAEKEEFRGAKGVEIRNFLASEAFQVLPPHLRPDKSQAIGMRWILSWKLKEDGTRKAKARAVLLGYQDSAYEHRATTSPVMTRQTPSLLRGNAGSLAKEMSLELFFSPENIQTSCIAYQLLIFVKP